MAATVNRNPTSDEAVSGTWNGTVGSRWSVVDDYPDTAGTDELTHGTTTAGNLTFGFSAFSIPSIATSISVMVDYYDYKNGSQACNIAARLKVGGSYFAASSHNPANGAASRTQRTDTWATNPKTGAAWTPAQINGTDGTNDLQAFGWVSSDANPSVTLSSIRLRVQYTAAYTLDAQPGALGLTGVSDSNRATRLVTASPGSLALSGLLAALAGGRVVVGDDGSFTITGVDAELTYSPVTGYTVVANAGALVLTGVAAGLVANRVLAAMAGSVALTGIVAALVAGHVIVGGTGGFTMAGANAELTYAVGGGGDSPAASSERRRRRRSASVVLRLRRKRY